MLHCVFVIWLQELDCESVLGNVLKLQWSVCVLTYLDLLNGRAEAQELLEKSQDLCQQSPDLC